MSHALATVLHRGRKAASNLMSACLASSRGNALKNGPPHRRKRVTGVRPRTRTRARPGYTLPMRRCLLLLGLIFLLAVGPVVAVDPLLADGVSGAPIAWSNWVGKRGPVAVLVWASWAPGAETVIERWDEISKECRDSGLHPVVVIVQESLADGRAALRPRGVPWIHDRHGALLKQYRVIKVPSILVVSAEGEALARLDPTAEALAVWRRR